MYKNHIYYNYIKTPVIINIKPGKQTENLDLLFYLSYNSTFTYKRLPEHEVSYT